MMIFINPRFIFFVAVIVTSLAYYRWIFVLEEKSSGLFSKELEYFGFLGIAIYALKVIETSSSKLDIRAAYAFFIIFIVLLSLNILGFI